jgi:hypothetical protein
MSRGEIHIASCKVFSSILEIQDFLDSVANTWDKFSVCPEVIKIAPGVGLVKESEEFHKEYIWSHSYNSRKNKKLEELKQYGEFKPQVLNTFVAKE